MFAADRRTCRAEQANESAISLAANGFVTERSELGRNRRALRTIDEARPLAGGERSD